jgi:hypothetical protein
MRRVSFQGCSRRHGRAIFVVQKPIPTQAPSGNGPGDAPAAAGGGSPAKRDLIFGKWGATKMVLDATKMVWGAPLFVGGGPLFAEKRLFYSKMD